VPREPSAEERRVRIHRALREGAELYNAGHFFETHEVLEDVWLLEEGEDKPFLQGLIKIAAAFVHFRKGTYQGMWDLLQAGRQMLEPYQPEHRGVELAKFLREIREWIPWAERLLAGEDLQIEDPIPRLVHRLPPDVEIGPEE
jgi:predicted metal-dependent hydrolase